MKHVRRIAALLGLVALVTVLLGPPRILAAVGTGEVPSPGLQGELVAQLHAYIGDYHKVGGPHPGVPEDPPLVQAPPPQDPLKPPHAGGITVGHLPGGGKITEPLP